MSDADEVVDPLIGLREKCGEHHCATLKEKLETCNDRVRSRSKTEENCHEEMIDFMHCVDHCALPEAWKRTK